jgi:transcription-repair coupling factor (superfamily II helicase)
LQHELSPALTPALTATTEEILPTTQSGVETLVSRLKSGERTIDVVGPVVAVTPDDEAADALERDLRFFLRGKLGPADRPPILRFQIDSVLPYDDFSPDRELELDRLRTLFLLAQLGLGPKLAAPPAVLITSARGLLRKVIPRAVMEEAAELLGKGSSIDRDHLAARLVRLGYVRVPLVEDPGTFAVRGGVIDLFSPVYSQPARLELFGDEVESLRLFDPETQRTTAEIAELYVSPAREILLDDQTKPRGIAAAREAGDRVNRPSKQLRELTDQIQQGNHAIGIEALLPGFYDLKLSTLADYLPRDPLFVLDDAQAIQREFHDLEKALRDDYASAVARGELALEPQHHFANPEQLLSGRRQLRSHALFVSAPPAQGPAATREDFREGPPLQLRFGDTQGLRQAILQHHGEEGALTPLVDQLTEWRDRGLASVIACHGTGQAERLKRLLLDRRLNVRLHGEPFADLLATASSRTGIPPLFDPGVHAHLFTGEVSRGFVSAATSLALLSDEAIFGQRSQVKVRKSKRLEQPFVAAFRDLNEGDLVVHIEHGIARYGGLTRMSIRGVDGDFLLLNYDGADKLYLPVEKLRQVQKFTGADPASVRLDKLGGTSWETRKRKVKEHLLKMAAELLDIYAARKAHAGHAFPPPDDLFRQFEAEFPFEETPDQEQAIGDVLSDMQSERPMDRLVCGDVGFGKTEVALRAAFKAVLDKRQVAILVPTTVLCSQHYRTFRERLKDYPVNVEMLSRLRDPKETKEIIAKLASGAIDIVIGTHKLLGKDVAFKDLGLVVVDEEQRFGVTHKEKLKKLRKLVDVLTLTATPIPRTLHMSLAGIRDLSIIATPPEDRRAIRTFVNRFEPLAIKEAIEREVGRGGQVFFVHNRVRSIAAIRKFLEELCPKARFEVAHGQMEEHRLDRVMTDFIERKFDVLICTSIIESGLDIPTANTILVNRADTFGLAQLYQIRGRVGRSS